MDDFTLDELRELIDEADEREMDAPFRKAGLRFGYAKEAIETEWLARRHLREAVLDLADARAAEREAE